MCRNTFGRLAKSTNYPPFRSVRSSRTDNLSCFIYYLLLFFFFCINYQPCWPQFPVLFFRLPITLYIVGFHWFWFLFLRTYWAFSPHVHASFMSVDFFSFSQLHWDFPFYKSYSIVTLVLQLLLNFIVSSSPNSLSPSFSSLSSPVSSSSSISLSIIHFFTALCPFYQLIF